jgi:hypothetical protein
MRPVLSELHENMQVRKGRLLGRVKHMEGIELDGDKWGEQITGSRN